MPTLTARAPRQSGDGRISLSLRRSTLAGVVVSLLVHTVALFMIWPELTRMREIPTSPAPGPLNVRISPAAEPKPRAEAPAPPTAAPEPARPRPQKPEPSRRNPVIVRRGQTPQRTLPAPDSTPLPPPFPQPPADASPETDMMAALNQKRAQRDAMEDKYRTDRAGTDLPNPDQLAMDRIKKNLAQRGDKNGIFTVRNMGVRSAEVYFRGWRSGDPRSLRGESFDVDAGVNGDIEAAVITKVIWVIRRDYSGDFDWESYRLQRVVKLSARQKDTAELSAFLRKELFTRY